MDEETLDKVRAIALSGKGVIGLDVIYNMIREIDRLRGKMKIYGRHHEGCRAPYREKCTCGWLKMERELMQ